MGLAQPNTGDFVLPDGVRSININNNQREMQMVYELPPATRTINYEGEEYTLKCPYAIFKTRVYCYDKAGYRAIETSLYFSPKPYHPDNKQLFLPCLPNMAQDGVLCLELDLFDASSFEEAAQLLASEFNMFFNTEFNNELNNALYSYYDFDEEQLVEEGATPRTIKEDKVIHLTMRDFIRVPSFNALFFSDKKRK